MPESREGDRVRFSGRSEAGFFPTTEQAIALSREFDGRREPFEVGGAVYGRSLFFIGSGLVEGIVCAREDVVLDARPGSERLVFRGGIVSRSAVVCAGLPTAIRDGVCGDVRNAIAIIRGDVVAPQVLLRNVVIVGNVHATSVRLENSVVVGAIVAKDQVTASASVLLQYHARAATFEGPCMFIHASGESLQRPVFAPYEDGAGEILPFDGRFYPALRGDASGRIANRPWDRAAHDGSRLFETIDWIDVPVRFGEDADDHAAGSASSTVLTIASRAMNLLVLKRHIERIAAWIRICFEFDHYGSAARREAVAQLRASCTPDELWIAEQAITDAHLLENVA
jgi:hypothetical protein